MRASPLLLLLAACSSEGGKGAPAAPEVSIETPADRDTYALGDEVAVVATVTDADTPADELRVDVRSDRDGALAGELTPESSGLVIVRTSALSAGTHALTVTAVDPGGLSGEATVTIGILVAGDSGPDSGDTGHGDSGDSGADSGHGDTGDTGDSGHGDTGDTGDSGHGDTGDSGGADSGDAAPVVRWDRPSDGDAFAEGSTITLRALAADAEDAPEALGVALTSDRDGALCGGTADATGAFECAAVLTVGTHRLTATATDSAGGAGVDAIAVEVVAHTAIDDDGDGWTEADGDCDDARTDVHPGAPEACDGVDQDCDGHVDEDVLVTYWTDADGDGYGDPDAPVEACSLPTGASVLATDCDDGDRAISPAADEVCDGLDDDCDGMTDEPDASGCSDWYYDGDGDGYGIDRAACLCAGSGEYTATEAGDCYDANASAHPRATGYASADRGDGSFDYDCDGAETPAYTGTFSCTTPWYDGWSCDSSSAGWEGSQPACGATGTWGSGCAAEWWTCAASTSTALLQVCR